MAWNTYGNKRKKEEKKKFSTSLELTKTERRKIMNQKKQPIILLI